MTRGRGWRTLFAGAREWVAALGAAGSVLPIVILTATDRLDSTAAVGGLVAGVLGLAAGITGITGVRNRARIGWLFAIGSAGLAAVAFVLMAVAPRS